MCTETAIATDDSTSSESPEINLTSSMTVEKDAVEVAELETVPHSIYRLDFETHCNGPGYWFADFFNAAGAQNYADNYSSVYASPDGYSAQSALFMVRAEAVRTVVGFRVIDQPLNLRNIRIRQATKPETLAWMDEQYAMLPPIRPTHPDERWQHLSNTRARLETGGPLRIVALGDSISNDLLNGLGHLLVERACPGVTIEMIHANGPEKSSDNYQNPEVLQRLVTRHRPDLFTVGGMSHDPDSVRNIIRQVRAACYNVEAVYIDVRVDGDPEREKRLEQLAEYRRIGEQDGFAVWDLTTPFHECLDRADHSLEWFQRDDHHVNDRGKQLLGQLFTEHLSL